MNQRTVIDDVRDQYAEAAKSRLSNDSIAVRSVVVTDTGIDLNAAANAFAASVRGHACT